MSGAPAEPSGSGLGASLLRVGAAGLALIVVVAGAFGLIGALSGDDEPSPEIAGDAEDDAPDGTDAADAADPDEGEDPTDSEGDPESDVDDEAATDEADDAPTEGDAQDDAGESDQEPGTDESTGDDAGEDGDQEPEDEPSSEDAAPDEADRVDPSSISVQVLDGVHTDGGAAADGLAGEVREAGYSMVAQNQSVAYDQTTVLWTSGSEQEARQLAADLGISQVRAQPGNLSESVDAHIVVGADRA